MPNKRPYWQKLLKINNLLSKIFNISLVPFSEWFTKIVIKLPHGKLWFRPIFLEEIYMALGLWEPYVCQVFKPQKGQVVLDVGAHIGYYTVKAAEAVGDSGLVIAVEPDSRNFQVL